MEINEMTTSFRHHRHHLGKNDRPEVGGLNQEPARAAKHERISLKKLHSLKNQLFCGFKSFTSSNEQTPSRAQMQTKPEKKQEVLRVDKSCDKFKLAKLQVGHQTKPTSVESKPITADRKNPKPSDEYSAKSGKSSSWLNLTSANQHQITADQGDSRLAALLADSHRHEEEDDSLAHRAVSHGCSLKRASFRRLTGRQSRKQSSDEQQAENMIKLIRQLDRLAKDSNERDNCPTNHEATYDEIFYLEKSWTSFVRLNSDDSDNLTKDPTDSDSDEKQIARSNLKVQQDAIWELLTSEVFYLKRLGVILNVFLETLRRLKQNSLLQEVDPARLTSNIEEVYLANRAFWTDSLLPMLIKSRLSACPLNPNAMEGAFTKAKNLFGSYYRYCLEHTACLDYLRDLSKRDQYFKVYLAWCESQKDCERLRLMDLLAKPMQRLTKYPLLLKAVYRRTDDPKQLDYLRQMIMEMEKFVLSVDLRLRDRDESVLLSSTANRIESLDICSSDVYCDEVSRIIVQYCREFCLCKPLFDCSYGCSRRLIFDSSQHTNSLGQLKFKDSQMNSKLDIVLLLFTDQLLICKQVSNRWYANISMPQNSQERSQITSSIRSSVYNKSFSSAKLRNSAKSSSNHSPGAWIKARSGSGNHLVDSLILADDTRLHSHEQSNQSRELPSAKRNGSGDRQPVSFHLSTSSLAGSAAREQFFISKSADGSRSGDSFLQPCPSKRPKSSPRLRAIRSPFPIDRLVLHELNDGHRIFCCQLNDSSTIATSFILHIGSGANVDTNKSINADASPTSHKQPSMATIEPSARLEPDGCTMHHLSPLSPSLKRRQQTQMSPARKLINLIEQTQLRYKAAANFHGFPLAPIEVWSKKPMENFPDPTIRRDRLDSSSIRTKTSSISRSSELLELGASHLSEQTNLAKEDSLLDNAMQESENSKAILEQEQSMLLKHGRYDELQSFKLNHLLNRRRLFGNLDQTTPVSLVSPNLSVSFDDPRMLLPPNTSSQNSVFELECNSDKGARVEHELTGTGTETDHASRVDEGMLTGEKPDICPTDQRNSVQLNGFASQSVTCGEQLFDRQRGQSWSCCSTSRTQLPSISGSEVEPTKGDSLPLTGRYLNYEEVSPKTRQNNNHRRQVNHLRRQNDIVSVGNEHQVENFSSILMQSSQSCGEPSISVDDVDPSQIYSTASNPNDSPSFEFSQINESASPSSLSQHRRYLSLAKRLMHDESSSSQSTTIDQVSLTLNDHQTGSLDSDEAKAHSQAVSIELGNLKARLSFCGPASQVHGKQQSTSRGEKNVEQMRASRSSSHSSGKNDRKTSEADDSLSARSYVYLDNVQQVDNQWSSGSFRGERVPENETDNQLIKEGYTAGIWGEGHRTNHVVSVPVLNVTNADSQSLRVDSDELSQRLECRFVDSAAQADMRNSLKEEATSNRVVRPIKPFRQEDNQEPPGGLKMQTVHHNGDLGSHQTRCRANQMGREPRSSSNSLDSNTSNGKLGADGGTMHDCHGLCLKRARESGSFDGDWSSINYRGNLLELKCIHKLIHQDESQDNTCGKVYLGFYEKLDLHLEQNSDYTSCQRSPAKQKPQDGVCGHSTQSDVHIKLAGRHSPARSDSSTSRRVKSLRMFTSDLIDSFLRATSSCSIHTKN